jgi:glycosyltransferase involved in cell wall biosynthesis
VVGDGPELRTLRRHAAPNVRFPGRLGDPEVEELMATCRAFVVTATEEFGIAAVEAQAAGRPVIARKGGGVLETVEEGTTGVLWQGGPAELAEAVRSFDDGAIDPQACVHSARRFGTDVFRRELPREVRAAIAESAAEPQEARRELRHVRRRAAFGPRRPSGLG